jgi:hypothetical protein
MQLWTPGADSEQHIYVNSEIHGLAITNLPIKEGGSDLLETIVDACKGDEGFSALSAVRTAVWPIVLMACRHWRLPVPPDFYIHALASIRSEHRASNVGEEETKMEPPGEVQRGGQSIQQVNDRS